MIGQMDDYYPFGLAFNSYSRENVVDQNNLYQGKELQDELDLNLYDFEWRQYDAIVGRTLNIDPHADNYFDFSPYSWAGNNPVIMIDPDGMDWYRHGETGAIMWQKGSDAVDGYENIGATVAFRQGDVTYTYQQNDVSAIEEHVLDPEDWETDQKNDANGKKVQCFTASKHMADKSGSETLGGGKASSIVTGEEVNEKDKHSVKSTGKKAEAQNYIDDQIDNGNSVVLGVDYKTGSPNNDDITDHFVAVSSRVTNLNTGKKSYRFYDPGTSHKSKGTHSTNVMSFNSAGLLTGKTNYSGKTYTVSQVRKNK
jgi:RHS repeat-associated protein